MTSASSFNGRVGIIQRVLADYRKPFFERLAATRGLSLSVFAGQPMPSEAIHTTDRLEMAHFHPTTNLYIGTQIGFLCWQSGVLTWLRQFSPAVLILEANPRILSNWLAIRWMKRKKLPVLGWGLGELPRSGSYWLSRFRAKVARSLVCHLSGMIAYSSKAAQDYIHAGMPADRVFIAHNAVDNQESEQYLAEFGSKDTWIKVWKESLQFEPLLPIILYVGRLVPTKKVDLLIEACIPLFDRCQLLIVGDGPSRSKLESKALPYGSRIRFIGYQSGAMLAKCFLASDIFVLPGSGGLAVYLAMSYGKPVVVSFGDGTEIDLVREGVSGVFVRLGDTSGLRKKIAELIEQPDLTRTMGQAGLAIVRNEINLEKMVVSFKRALAAATVVISGLCS